MESETVKKERSPYLVPFAIIVAGVLVAGAILLNGSLQAKKAANAEQPGTDQINLQALRPVTSGEHFLGDFANAQVVLVEYSDLECPFCKEFHSEMQKIMADPELKGKVGWVYRHFPITSRHPKAVQEAIASECAADVGGNAGFWNYIARLFEITPTNNGLDLAELPKIAATVGLNVTAFNECMAKNTHEAKIQQDFENGVAVGVSGTPWSLLMHRNGNVTPVNGYETYEQLKAQIVALLKS